MPVSYHKSAISYQWLGGNTEKLTSDTHWSACSTIIGSSRPTRIPTQRSGAQGFQSSLGLLGTPTGCVQTRTALRGGMTYRSYRVSYPNRAIRVWRYELPDGKLEQYQVAPIG